MAKTTEVSPAKKELRVTFEKDSRTPHFEFVGVWRGIDISTVQSNLRRAYLVLQRDLRRASASETSNTSTKGETQ